MIIYSWIHTRGIIGILLMITVYILVKKGYAVCPTDEKKSFREIVKQFKISFLLLIAPLIILVGLLTGFTSPTEAGVLAIVYSVFLTIIHREISFKEFKIIIEEAMLNFSEIMVLISFTVSMGWIFTYSRVPHIVAEYFLRIIDNPILILLIVCFVLIILGSLIDPIPVLLITAPIFLPLVERVGINLIQFGLIMCYTMIIGLFTPPVGMGLYIITKITDLSFKEAFIGFLPFFISLILSAILFATIPKLSLWLPSLIFD